MILAFSKGAGTIGLYNKVSFSCEGFTEFIPGPDATPHIGAPGKAEKVDEIKLEIVCEGEEQTREIVREIKQTHPYEESVVLVHKLEDF